jgi:hypothetical protein
MIAPGSYGIEIAEKLCRQMGGDGLAAELGGEAIGQVLVHDEANEEGVARSPLGGVVAEGLKLEREMVTLQGDGGVDSAGVDLEIVKLIFGDGRYGAVGGGAQLERSLDAVVLEKRRPEDLGELASGVAAEHVHLKEAVLGGDEALCKDEVVERGSANVGHSVGIALNRDRGRDAGYAERAVDLRERCGEEMLNVTARGEEGGEAQDEKDRYGYGQELGKTARTRPGRSGVALSVALDQGRLIVGTGETHRYGKSKC